MKKLLFLFVLMCGFTYQSKSVDVGTLVDSTKQFMSEVGDSVKGTVRQIDTSSVFKEMYSDFKGGIVAIASSLKVGTEHVYGVLVRQQFVYSIMYLALLIIGFILIIHWIKMYKKTGDGEEDWGDINSPTGLGLIRFIQIWAALIMLGIGLINFDIIFGGLINPEYGAIKDIVEMVKDLKK